MDTFPVSEWKFAAISRVSQPLLVAVKRGFHAKIPDRTDHFRKT